MKTTKIKRLAMFVAASVAITLAFAAQTAPDASHGTLCGKADAGWLTSPPKLEPTDEATIKKMKNLTIPGFCTNPDLKLSEAIAFLREASVDFDDPGLPREKRGIDILFQHDSGDDPFLSKLSVGPTGHLGGVISFYDALTLVCESVGYTFDVEGNVVVVRSKQLKPKRETACVASVMCAADVEDPAAACRKMMREAAYSGCWSGGEMFGKFSIAFDPDGKGFFIGGMFASTFKWTADAEGNISIVVPGPYGGVDKVSAKYDPSRDVMSLWDSRAGGRNFKYKSERPARELEAEIQAKLESTSRPNDEAKYERKKEHRAFDSLEALVAWLVDEPSAAVAKSALVPTDDPRFSDEIASVESSQLMAELAVGYFERGERPSDEEVEKIRWHNGRRHSSMPPAQAQHLDGIEEVERLCSEASIIVGKGGLRQKKSEWGWWYCCKDELDIRVPQERREDFIRVLSPRLASRFPCTAETTTIIPRKN